MPRGRIRLTVCKKARKEPIPDLRAGPNAKKPRVSPKASARDLILFHFQTD